MRTYGSRWFKEGSLIGEYAEQFGVSTTRQKQNMALSAAKVDAELASKAKSEFIANMSHELRTPLNAIIGFSEMLATQTVSGADKVEQYSGYIGQAAEHLLALINGILDVSKIQAGNLSVELESVDVNEVLESCLLIVEAKARDKMIVLETTVAPGLPNFHADPLRLKQILINLLSNAVKFTPAGGRVELDITAQDNGFGRMILTDTGIGMSTAEIGTAMSPFGQVDAGFNKRHEGTGLGLPIAHALARLHGGNLKIESQKGQGTRVTVTLPVYDKDKAAATSPPNNVH